MLFLNDRRLRVSHARTARKVGLSRTKIKIHIDANGEMVLIIRDVEGDNLFLLVAVLFELGKD